MLVAAASLVPTFGAAAYMLAKPLRSNRALAIIAFDRMFRKLPARLYSRLHVAPVMVFHAGVASAETAPQTRSMRERVASVRRRIARLRGQRLMIAAVLVPNMAIVVFGGVLYFGYGTRVVFDERGLMNTADAVQLVAAGVAGMLAYRAFWRVRAANTPLDEAAGIMFWGLAGAGLLFLAADDYFTLHEQIGDGLADVMSVLPLYTNSANDFITIGVGITGLSVLYVFKHELVADRPSSTLLVAAVLASGVMVAVDAFGKGVVRPLEFPAQVSAVGFFLLAFVARYREVRALETAAEGATEIAPRPSAPQRLMAGAAAPLFAARLTLPLHGKHQ
jgi:hypothetical protein